MTTMLFNVLLLLIILFGCLGLIAAAYCLYDYIRENEQQRNL